MKIEVSENFVATAIMQKYYREKTFHFNIKSHNCQISKKRSLILSKLMGLISSGSDAMA